MSDSNPVNKSPVTAFLLHPSREKYRAQYKTFLEGRGFVFPEEYQNLTNSSCKQQYVYLTHADKGLTKIEVA